MRRLKAETPAQIELEAPAQRRLAIMGGTVGTPAPSVPQAHAPSWRELTLLVGYLVIFVLSILTVLLPTTDNQEEHVEKETASAEGTGNVPK